MTAPLLAHEKYLAADWPDIPYNRYDTTYRYKQSISGPTVSQLAANRIGQLERALLLAVALLSPISVLKYIAEEARHLGDSH